MKALLAMTEIEAEKKTAQELNDIIDSHEVPRHVVRVYLNKLEAELLKQEQIETPIVSHFAEGLYAREMFIPKGTMLTGRIHKKEHMNFVMKGDISVMTENGRLRIQAPCIMTSHPGTKRAGYAFEDTIWVTVHATDKTDVDEIIEDISCVTYEEYLLSTASCGLIEEESCH